MVEPRTINQDTQLVVLLQQKWHSEIEKVVDKVKLGVIPAKKRTKTDKWFRHQWYSSMMRDRKRTTEKLKVQKLTNMAPMKTSGYCRSVFHST